MFVSYELVLNNKTRVNFHSFQNLYIFLSVELLTTICTTLKRDQFLNHFLIFIEIAQQVYMFTPKHKLWPYFIKNGHNLYFGVYKYTCCAISMENKKWFKNWSRFRVVHLLVVSSTCNRILCLQKLHQ